MSTCTCTHDHPLDEIQINDMIIDHMYNQDHFFSFGISSYLVIFLNEFIYCVQMEMTTYLMLMTIMIIWKIVIT